MVVPYPYILTTTILNTDAVRDGNGNWVQPAIEPTIISQPCRAEPNGNSFITLVDGSKYSYAFVVYMPATAPEIPTDVAVTITGTINGNAIEYKGTVKQFYRGQLNCRLWL